MYIVTTKEEEKNLHALKSFLHRMTMLDYIAALGR